MRCARRSRTCGPDQMSCRRAREPACRTLRLVEAGAEVLLGFRTAVFEGTIMAMQAHGDNRPAVGPRLAGRGSRVQDMPNALIYRSAPSVMQSGPRPNDWLLEFAPAAALGRKPVMGWIARNDPFRPIHLRFPDRQSAVRYAETQDWSCLVFDERPAHRTLNSIRATWRYRGRQQANANTPPLPHQYCGLVADALMAGTAHRSRRDLPGGTVGRGRPQPGRPWRWALAPRCSFADRPRRGLVGRNEYVAERVPRRGRNGTARQTLPFRNGLSVPGRTRSSLPERSISAEMSRISMS